MFSDGTGARLSPQSTKRLLQVGEGDKQAGTVSQERALAKQPADPMPDGKRAPTQKTIHVRCFTVTAYEGAALPLMQYSLSLGRKTRSRRLDCRADAQAGPGLNKAALAAALSVAAWI